MKKKRIGILIGILIGLVIGLGISSIISGSKVMAEDLESEKAVSSKHGYGIYMQFEYEIVSNSYGSFVVIRPRYGEPNDFNVAGL